MRGLSCPLPYHLQYPWRGMKPVDIDLRGKSNSYGTITICTKPTKLFIDVPLGIISERWCYATAVIRWLWSQSDLIWQFWPSKHQKMDSNSYRFVSVARHAATVDISLACQIIDDTIGALWYSFGIFFCFVLLFTFGTKCGRARRENAALTPTKYSGSHQIADNCRKPAKLFINVSPYIISGRRW